VIGFQLLGSIDNFNKVAEAVEKAAFRNVGHAAAAIRKDAIESIKPAEGASEPGTPPHTHTSGVTKKGKLRRGELQRAIVFAHNREENEALVGPRFSVVGTSGAAHEFGGEYLGQDYPERPFMSPALENNIDRFGGSFEASIGQ